MRGSGYWVDGTEPAFSCQKYILGGRVIFKKIKLKKKFKRLLATAAFVFLAVGQKKREKNLPSFASGALLTCFTLLLQMFQQPRQAMLPKVGGSPAMHTPPPPLQGTTQRKRRAGAVPSSNQDKVLAAIEQLGAWLAQLEQYRVAEAPAQPTGPAKGGGRDGAK